MEAAYSDFNSAIRWTRVSPINLNSEVRHRMEFLAAD
jgi:hypothetical protein